LLRSRRVALECLRRDRRRRPPPVTLGVVVLVALGGGLTAVWLALRSPRWAAFLGLGTAAIALVGSLRLSAGDALVLGAVTVAPSETSRLLAIAWAGSLVLLGLIGLATEGSATSTAASPSSTYSATSA